MASISSSATGPKLALLLAGDTVGGSGDLTRWRSGNASRVRIVAPTQQSGRHALYLHSNRSPLQRGVLLPSSLLRLVTPRDAIFRPAFAVVIE